MKVNPHLLRRISLALRPPEELSDLRDDVADKARASQRAAELHLRVLNKARTVEQERPALIKKGMAHRRHVEAESLLRAAKISYLRTGTIDLAALKAARSLRSNPPQSLSR